MFKKYNINDLYLASINVMYNEKQMIKEVEFGGIFESGISGYGYITVIKKEGDKYIDLQNPNRKLINEKKISAETTYVIEYMEPLNKYYTQEGMKINKLGKRKTLKIARNYYDEYHKSHINYLNEKYQ